MNRFNQSTVACDISLYENMTCEIVLQTQGELSIGWIISLTLIVIEKN